MKIKYDRDADVLTLEISDKKIDHAEEAGPMIIHLTEDNKPVLIEILDASEFFTDLTKISITASGQSASEAKKLGVLNLAKPTPSSDPRPKTAARSRRRCCSGPSGASCKPKFS